MPQLLWCHWFRCQSPAASDGMNMAETVPPFRRFQQMCHLRRPTAVLPVLVQKPLAMLPQALQLMILGLGKKKVSAIDY